MARYQKFWCLELQGSVLSSSLSKLHKNETRIETSKLRVLIARISANISWYWTQAIPLYCSGSLSLRQEIFDFLLWGF